MERHRILSDFDFINQFINCELPPSDFTHEAHLRLAWLFINSYGIKSAEKSLQDQLQIYVKHVGAKDKYNKTLTIASIKAVYHFMLKSNSITFKDFIKEFPRLKFNFKELMACHYGFDIYDSKTAKSNFLEPDLLPFD